MRRHTPASTARRATLFLYLVHHGEAVDADVDPRRPLSAAGRAHVERLAGLAAAHGAHPEVVWHSGKLRARQTAEAFWRACNPLGTMTATRDLQPDDPPGRIRDRLLTQSRDLLIAGHFPHLRRLLPLLLVGSEHAEAAVQFPAHGIVGLASDDGISWREVWRIE